MFNNKKEESNNIQNLQNSEKEIILHVLKRDKMLKDIEATRMSEINNTQQWNFQSKTIYPNQRFFERSVSINTDNYIAIEQCDTKKSILRQSTLPNSDVVFDIEYNFPSNISLNQDNRLNMQRQSIEYHDSIYDQNPNFENSNYVQLHKKTKLLPTIPTNIESKPRNRILRQTTIPNPEVYVKKLPLSPPKHLLRTPRSSDAVKMTQPIENGRFLPISPQKRGNFLFPDVEIQSNNTNGNQKPYSSTQSVNINKDQIKIVKLRSHSSEEYPTRKQNLEHRRLLPETPISKSQRSFAPLVRQNNIDDFHLNKKTDQSSQVTFGEAKENIFEYCKTKNTLLEGNFEVIEKEGSNKGGLTEAEIKVAVENAASIFKKVVLRKRIETCDDHKIVFLTYSSSEDSDIESLTLDWDYFDSFYSSDSIDNTKSSTNLFSENNLRSFENEQHSFSFECFTSTHNYIYPTYITSKDRYGWENVQFLLNNGITDFVNRKSVVTKSTCKEMKRCLTNVPFMAHTNSNIFIENQITGSDKKGEHVEDEPGLHTENLDEDGLPEDDSWKDENSSNEDLSDEDDESNKSDAYAQGHREKILYTIQEESCEESEDAHVNKIKIQNRKSASELEKYFFFGLGQSSQSTSKQIHFVDNEDVSSDISSPGSEGLDSIDIPQNEIIFKQKLFPDVFNSKTEKQNSSFEDLQSSRLEKYFLSGLGCSKSRDSDDSESVGSDSETLSTPGQRRKKKLIKRSIVENYSGEIDINEKSENSSDSEFVIPTDAEDKELKSEKTLNHKILIERKDSFNNWSSDEDTNFMLSRMRQFFKSLIAASEGLTKIKNPAASVEITSPVNHFEEELTRLMKTVPGINDEHVKEIVEYLSTDDYESSEIDEEGDIGDGGLKETALVYKQLVASISKIGSERNSLVDTETTYNKPDITRVLQHIGDKLCTLMHEVGNVSTSESLKTIDDNRNNLPDADFSNKISNEEYDYERFSWRGSFESALLVDSRTKLNDTVSKRRSVGDLISSNISIKEEKLDRVRSCGSIGGASDWQNENMGGSSSVPDTLFITKISDDEKSLLNEIDTNLRFPQNQKSITGTSTLPKEYLSTSPTLDIAKSARYRPTGYIFRSTSHLIQKKSSNLQTILYTKNSKKRNKPKLFDEDKHLSPAHSNSSNEKMQSHSEEDIDRLVAIHQRHSISSLGLRSSSLASVYSGAGDGHISNIIVNGQIEFGMQYNYKLNTLDVHIVRCKDLAAADIKRNRSDPYVKVYLLPDKTKSGKRKTKIRKNSLNPFFDEIIRFYISLSSLENRSLWLSVWNSDIFGKNDFLGEILLNLKGHIFDNSQPKLYNLQEKSDLYEDICEFRGEILVALKYVTSENKTNTKGQLHVLLKEVKHLCISKPNGTCDVFCKSYLLPEKSKQTKQKTPVKRKSSNPQFNYTFIYDDIIADELYHRAIELTFWDRYNLSSNEFLGGVRFSSGTGKYYDKCVQWNDSNGKELSLWQQMINRPNFWVESLIPLRYL